MMWVRSPVDVYNRNGTYYFSHAVPSDLRNRLPKRKIEVLLCTKSVSKAARSAAALSDRHEPPEIPMGVVVSREIDIRGSRWMSPKNYPTIFYMIRSGVVASKTLIDRELALEEGTDLLKSMDHFPETGVAVLTSF